MRSSTANNPMDQQIFLCCRSADGLDAQLSALAKQLAWRALEQMTAQDQPTLQAAGSCKRESSGRPLFCGTTPLFPSPTTGGWQRQRCLPLPLGIDIERSSRVSLHAAERMFSPAGKALDAANRPCGPLCSAVDPAGGICQMDRSGTCRSVPLEARQGKVSFSPANAHQILCSDSCCLAGSLLLGNIASLVAQKPLHPSPSLILRVEENGIFQKKFENLIDKILSLCI